MGQRLDHWELGFSQFWLDLYLRTGLAVHPHTDLLVELLSQHAPFPFVFPREVGWVSLRSFALDLISLWERFDMHRNGARWPHCDRGQVPFRNRRSASVRLTPSCELDRILSRPGWCIWG